MLSSDLNEQIIINDREKQQVTLSRSNCVKVFEHILTSCIDSSKKNILVIYDDYTDNLIDFAKCCNENFIFSLYKISMMKFHGDFSDRLLAEKIINSDAVACITKYSLAHTQERVIANNNGIPFLSMPGYELSILDNPAFMADYKSKFNDVKKYTDIITQGNEVKITSDTGTNLAMNIRERHGNCCPGFTSDDILLASPPDIECNTAPVEGLTNGILVVDGSITDYRLGLLETDVRLQIRDGKIVDIYSDSIRNTRLVKEIFSSVQSENAMYVGELGIGFNDKAKLCGNMLIDEGAEGCIHLGMGSNWTIGGRNKVNFHLDFVMKNVDLSVDSNLIIKKGELIA